MSVRSRRQNFNWWANARHFLLFISLFHEMFVYLPKLPLIKIWIYERKGLFQLKMARQHGSKNFQLNLIDVTNLGWRFMVKFCRLFFSRYFSNAKVDSVKMFEFHHQVVQFWEFGENSSIKVESSYCNWLSHALDKSSPFPPPPSTKFFGNSKL